MNFITFLKIIGEKEHLVNEFENPARSNCPILALLSFTLHSKYLQCYAKIMYTLMFNWKYWN